ncbi:MAG: phosphatase, partial [Bacteroidota bacterium]
TLNLAVAKIESSHKFSILFNDKISVKLGEGGINTNRILPVPFQRGLDAVKKHLETCSNLHVEKTYAFATSAIRSSANGADFVEEIKEQFGLDIQVIDGEREAELIYEGVRLGVSMHAENSLIMDIGGGSTEFIIATSEQVHWKQSFNLGAARLLEKFNPSDPIKNEEIAAIENYFDIELLPLEQALKKFKVAELIGSSGSFDTFAEIITHKYYSPIDLNLHSSYDFVMKDFYSIHGQLLNSTKEQRLTTPGIIEMRVDMIVISAVFTNYILKKFKLEKMRLSTYALKEGVIAQLMKSTI